MVYADALGEWTASQITDFDAAENCVGVVELDWSAPEPATGADLGGVRPLRLTHHSRNGKLSHCDHSWGLSRSFTVIGSLPPMVTELSYAYASCRGPSSNGRALRNACSHCPGTRRPSTWPGAGTCTNTAIRA